MARSTLSSRFATASVVALASIGLLLVSAAPAHAATVVDGPIGLGDAAGFGVLGATTVTSTGPTVVGSDAGVSPGTAITGFPPGIVVGVQHPADEQAAQAQSDLTTAYNITASLTPTQTGLGDLAGLTLTPGVYSGGELSLNGELTLAGSAESVWVFQAASTLMTGSGTVITLTGGASACNVFWQVGSSATLGTDSQFVGTILANASITATTNAEITGRLLADTGAVTLDSNLITAPIGCDEGTTSVSTSPTITSSTPPAATVGAEYSFTVTATGTPTPTYSVTTGTLPAGLELDDTTGVISGTPTTAGPSTFTISVSNGTAPDATATYTLVTEAAALAPPANPGVPAAPGAPVTPGEPNVPTLPETGSEVTAPLLGGALLLVLGGLAVLVRRRSAAPETLR